MSKIDERPDTKCPLCTFSGDCKRHEEPLSRCGYNGNNAHCIFWPYTEEYNNREKNMGLNGKSP